MKNFSDLSEQEILALAISLEEEDARIYGDFAEGLKADYPATAAILNEMRAEEDGHRHRLHRAAPPEVRRAHPADPPAGRQGVRPPQADLAGAAAGAVRRPQGDRADGAGDEALLRDRRPAGHRRRHPAAPGRPGRGGTQARAARRGAGKRNASSGAAEEEAATRQRLFVLQVIQPGLAGLMDGSVSTLAPLFAAAFATRNSWETFLVGLAASLGAGISMGFAEALSDDGSLTGRGRPVDCAASSAG